MEAEPDLSQTFDVLVIGGGNAALCAAMTAARSGASVLLLECAPEAFRGGDSRHTRNLRYVHTRANAFLTGPYDENEFWDDLLRVTAGKTDEHLARLTLRESTDIGVWMEAHGGRFQAPLRGTLNLSRTNAFFLGGGKALLNAYYHTAQQLGVRIAYESEVTDLIMRDGRCCGALVGSGESAPAGPGADGRGGRRRISGQHRLAQEVLGRGGRQLSYPRHPIQHRHPAAGPARQRGSAGGRSAPVSRRGDRRPSAQV